MKYCSVFRRDILRSITAIFAASFAQAVADTVDRGGTRYETFAFAPKHVELVWTDDSGVPLRQFVSVQQLIERKQKRVRFLMNAGIFETGGVPSGLLVIDGKELRPINTASGHGNFFLRPNGVFFIRGGKAFVVSTDDYVASNVSPDLAVQSGPLLLQHGRTHPAFRAQSMNYLHRNGVGILPDGSVLFAITEFGQARYPNLFEFADFFRSRGCSDALFLDGDISQVIVDPKAAIPPGNNFGAIFAVTEKQN